MAINASTLAPTQIARPAQSFSLGALLRGVLLYCVADNKNPFYQLNLIAKSRTPSRLWISFSERTRMSLRLAFAVVFGVAAWVLFNRLPLRTHIFIRDHLGPITVALIFLSYVLPAWGMRRGFSKLIFSKGLEPFLMTRLTDAELVRGIVVPEIRRTIPTLACIGLICALWPFYVGIYDGLHKFMLFSLLLTVLLNVLATAWIAFGFVAAGVGFQNLAFAVLAMFVLDPCLLVWESGLFSVTTPWTWDPAVFFFTLVELFYCIIKLIWAYLIICDLKTSFRRSMTEG